MIIDILVLIVLLISAFIAFLRGFIREVLTITGVVGGLIASYIGGPALMPLMHGWLGVEEGKEPERLLGVLPYDIVADALSYGLIFIVVVILLSVFSHYLAEGARNIGLGAVDRTLGFIFGILRGIVLLGLLYLPIHLFIDEEAKEAWFKNSTTHFYLEKTAAAMAEFIPSSAKEDAARIVEDSQKASQTRKKLEEINLLPSQEGAENAGQGAPQNSQPQNSAAQKNGYTEDFRERMDQLFDENTQEKPAAQKSPEGQEGLNP